MGVLLVLLVIQAPIGNKFLYIFINMNDVLYKMYAQMQAIGLFLFINNEINLKCM